MQKANFQQALQHHQQGQLDQAEALYNAVLKEQPDHIDALHFLGVLAHQRGQEQRAIELISRALELAPDNAAAYSNLGLAQHALQQYEFALASYNRALSINPNNADALFNRGHSLRELKRFNEAIASYEQALVIKPDLDFIFGTWLYLKMNLCQWDDFAQHLNTLINGIKRGEKMVVPFSLLTMSSSLTVQKQAAETYTQAKHPNAGWSLPAKHKHEKIKIGYFSSDFRQHPVAYLIAELIECHDRTQFEIIAFSFYAAEQKDVLRLRLESAFDKFIDVSSQSDEQIVQLARELEIDIAIDLNGCTDGCRTNIFAMRAAPIQATYLGYSGTLGADYIDYIIADSVLIPDEYQAYYTEKVVYLPNSYMVSDSKRLIADKAITRTEYGLPEQGIVFCCFNNHYKITPEIFAVWMHILHQVQNSVLWLSLASDEVIDNLHQQASKLGIATERLIFAPRLPSSAEHLARHRLADLFLDTTPYNAHTTSNDALWAGLPVLTCTGEAAASRVAASLLTALGLPELITNNFEAYQALAIQLAKHPEQLAVLKQKLANNRLTYPLFDTVLFAQHIEEAYQAMFARYQADLAPEHIYVSSKAGNVHPTNMKEIASTTINHFQQAFTLHQQGQLTEATRHYEAALQSNPQHIDALHFFGVLKHQQKKSQQAVDLITRALGIDNQNAAAHSNLGLALHALQQFEDAINSYNHSLALKINNAEAYYNRGNALLALKHFDEALADYEQALAINPSYIEALSNRGITLRELHRFDEALANYQRIITILPNSAEALVGCAIIHQELKHYNDAVLYYDRALAANPDLDFMFGNRLQIKMTACIWQDFEQQVNDLEQRIAGGKKAAIPFTVQAVSHSASLQKQAAYAYNQERYPAEFLLSLPAKYQHQKIRIGYFSSDFCHHPVAYLTAELFERHDRTRFEVIAFSFHITPQKDDMRLRLEASFDKFIDVSQYTDKQIVQLARELEIDITIDLNGCTEGCRTGVFAMRAAPIQVSYIGYLGTMGMDYYDYLLADETLIPKDQQIHYSEKIAYLPNSFQANDSTQQIANKVYTRTEQGLPEQGVVFCCFNNHYKITPIVFDSWMRILQQVPHSVLWLLGGNTVTESNLRAAATARGIDSSRLVFAQRLPMPENLARQRLADLFLDTSPYNAGATASAALWAGLPVLTYLGETYSSRMAASLLYAIGLPELVSQNLVDYETLAIELARQPAQLNLIKEKLAANRLSYPLFDTALFTQHIENLYQQMLARYQADLAPDHIYVNDVHVTGGDTFAPTKNQAVAVSITRHNTQEKLDQQNTDSFLQAVEYHQKGQLEQAEILYRETLQTQTQHADALHLLGVIAKQRGQNQSAMDLIKQALQINPNNAAAHSNIALAYQALEYFDQALSHCDHALAIQPDHAEALFNRAIILQCLKCFEEAVDSYGCVLSLQPNNAEAALNRGVALQELGRLDEALASYTLALSIRPDYVNALSGQGAVLSMLKRYEDALSCYQQILTMQANNAEILLHRGEVLHDLKRFSEAIASFGQAIVINPNYAEAFCNRGNALIELNRYEQALEDYDRALTIQADFAEAHFNRANALQGLHQFNKALASYDRALTIRPDYVNAHWNKSICLLLIGDFANGWREYQWREQLRKERRLFIKTLWQGQQVLQNKTILLHAEQGLGDTLQFCRYVQQVKALGATVILEVQPELTILLASLKCVDVLLQKGDSLPDFDYHCPLLSLPLAFNTSLDNIPNHVPYLFSQAERVQKWQAILGEKTLPRIGVVWSGNVHHANDHNRSIPLGQFSQLFNQSAQFISLQKELRNGEAVLLANFTNVLHVGEQLRDFADTAALCELMDKVITVDTSIAHLAGAMGKPVDIFLPYIPDWRWMLSREDNPWYPSARLFRQTIVGDWQTAFDAYQVSDSVTRQSTNNDKFNQAMQLHQQGQLAEAIHVYQAILQVQPEHSDALHFLGVLSHQQGENQRALEFIKQSLSIRPDNVSACLNLAIVWQTLNRIEEAIDSYDRALLIQPYDANTLFMRGNLCLASQRFAEAVASYDNALMIQDNAEILSNRGVALQNLNRWDEALISYDRALAIKPDYAAALTNRGNVLKDLKRFDEALSSYDRALSVEPNDVETLTNRGNVLLKELNRLEDAISSYDSVLATKPDYVDALYHKGIALQDLKQWYQALACYEQTLAINPDYSFLFGTWLFLKMKLCDWHNFDQHLQSLQQQVAEGKKTIVPFSMQALSSSPVMQKKAAEIYIAAKYPSALLLPVPTKYAHQKIKVGYFSSDFRNHPVAHLMAELFEQHDKERFEIIAFSFYETTKKDEMRLRLEAAFDQFFDVSTQSDEQVVQLARELEIDIALDLNGCTEHCRTNIFAMRAAPIQVNYLGYPGTMGADYMDYLIASPVLIPEQYQSCYSEKIVYLPNNYMINACNTISDRQFTREELGLPEKGFIFCCFNNNYKIMPDVFAGWMRILYQVADSVLWLLEDNDAVANNLRFAAVQHGIAPNRLVFAPRLAMPEYLARHRVADLFLDTLPYNAHSTASSALWSGLPVLTRIGETFAGRVAAGLLDTLDLPELITVNEADYEALAIQLATHPEQLAAIKQKLADKRLTSPLFNNAPFTRDIEITLQLMFERNQADLAPDHIYVSSRLSDTYFTGANLSQPQTVGHVSDSVIQQSADDFYNQANAQLANQQFLAAIENYNQAVAIQPNHAEALSNRAIAWQYLGDLKEALLSYDRAIAIKPDYVDALYNRGTLLRAMNRFEDAIDNYQQALNIEPEYAFLFGTWLYMKMTICAWDNFDAHINQLITGIKQGKKLAIPFFTQVVISSPALLQQAAITYAQAQDPSIAMPIIAKRSHKKIRLGYFSSDFRQHPVSYLMASLFEQHDKQRFETFAFSLQANRKDAMRLRLESAFDKFIDVSSQSDAQVVQLAREMEIDIAIDLNGFTDGCRPNIFAMRVAPIQVSYIGYLGTMGADYMDYLLADNTLIPENHQAYYQEKIAYLPHSFQVNDSKLTIARKTPSRVSVGLPKKGVVFCCFNNCYKITPEVFASWMRILQAVKDSVLWLLADNANAKANLRQAAQQQGIAPERLIFANRVAMPDYLARHRLADLFLDTRPYNAGATASAALWAGLPVLTCIGDTFSSRMGASLLHAVGLPELITDNLAAYEALAIQLANQPKQLAAIKKKLARNRSTSPLFDTALFTQHLETIYQAMFERYQADLAPDHIHIVGRVSDSVTRQGIIATLINRFTKPSNVGKAHPTSLRDDAGASTDAFPRRQSMGTIEQVNDAPISDSLTQQTDVDDLINQGNDQEDQGLLENALASYEQAIAINPNNARAYSNRGNVLQTLKRFSEALQSYDQALAIRVDYAEAFYNKGNTLQAINRLDEAVTNYEQCLAIKPDFALALIARGAALQSLKRFDDALASYSQALAITPEHQFLFGDWLYTKINLCDWSDFDDNINTLAHGIEQDKNIALPFAVMVLSSSARAQRKALQRYSEEIYPSAFLAPALTKHKHKKIKVAYFSSDFRNHPMSFLTAELFEYHDRSQFEIIAFSYSPASDKDEMRLKIESLFDQFIDINPYTDEQAVRLCRQLEVDIAVDLNGFTAHCRPQLFAMRVAPLQMSYLGYAGTMGTTYIDYFLADKILIPTDYQQHYAEKIVYLPNSYMINSRRIIADRVFTRLELNLPEQAFVFCCFNNTYKITPAVFDVWMRLLHQVRGSVLWLLEDNVAAAKNLRREAIARGINAERLIFAPRLSMPEHLARQRLADLFLDTLPCNAHTTTGDALLVDLPVLTCMGETFPSRVAASLLNAVGLPELITNNLADYEALALKLATHPEQLAALKQKLATNRVTYPLFDTALFTQHLENAYQQMYSRYQSDLAPEHIYVSDAHSITDDYVGRVSDSVTRQSPDELINQGNNQEDQGLLTDALASYEQAIAINPNYARAYSNRGNVLQALKRYAESIASYDKALELKPDYAEALYNKGNALNADKQAAKALICYEQALNLKPDFIQALLGRGNALHDLQQLTAALRSYEQALEIYPDYAEAHYNCGKVLIDLERNDQALASYKRALAINPDYVEAWVGQGELFQLLKRLPDALASYDHALTIKPDYAEVFVSRAIVLQQLNRLEEAVANCEQALIIKPELDFTFGTLFSLKMKLCDWRDFDKNLNTLTEKIMRGEKAATPFFVHSVAVSIATQKKTAEIFAQQNYPAPLLARRIEKHKHSKIKLAYFSADFRNHAVAYLTAELFALHDRSRFEVIAFSLHCTDRKDDTRLKLEQLFDQFIDVSKQSDEQVLQLASELEIDIAVDLNGFTEGCRTSLFAARVAPIQVSYLGYSGTMGADYMDYILADSVLIPEKYRPYYTEKIVYLPHSYMVNDTHRLISDRMMTRGEFGLSEQGFVFCCFNNAHKITPDVFAVWMKILQQVEGSVLWLSECNEKAKANLQQQAIVHGINAQRLIFARRLPSLPEHLARHRLADLFLDTLPYNAHTTSSDALWAGLPVLTCVGEAFTSRVAASLLTALGLVELISSDFDTYQALAIQLATHPEQLATLKQKLADNRLTYPLFDTALFTQHIEDAYQVMFERYQADLVPDHIYVPSRVSNAHSATDIHSVARVSDNVTRQTDVDDLINQGNAQEDQGQLENALASYEQAIAINPNSARAYSNRGNVLQSLNRVKEAIASYDQAVAIKPDYAEAFYNKANTLQANKQLAEAVVCYDQALSLKPDLIQALIGRGNVLHDLRHSTEALRNYDQALAIKPDYAEAFYNRGNVLTDLKHNDEALISYDSALVIKPDYADVWVGRGVVLQELKRFPEALQSYERVLKLNPDPEYTFGDWLFVKMNVCHWDGLDNDCLRLNEGIEQGKKMATPFITLSATSLPAVQKKAAVVYAQEKFHNALALAIPKYTHQKIKIGYFSADFRHHPVAYLTAELFERHDKARFEIIAFSSYVTNQKDDIRLRLEAAFDQFFDISQQSNEQIIQLARQLELDIAVDLTGFTKGGSTGVFAMRVAPIQVSYIGYLGTMGTDYMDYLLADEILIPQSHQTYYTEKIVYLPHSFQVNDSKLAIADRTFNRTELGLPEQGFVFCCFNNNYKITPELFTSWMRILQQVDGSVLWLLADNQAATDNLQQEAIARGVDARRLVFAQRLAMPEYLARHRMADLFLDTSPYNAGATASAALWSGLPLLTYLGETFAGRMAASLLYAVGLPELVTQNLADYEAMAIHLGNHPEQIMLLKQKLVANRLSYPLFNTALFTQHIEDAYQTMFDRYQADLSPDHIYIPSRMGNAQPANVGLVSDSLIQQSDEVINQGNDQEDNGRLENALASYEQAIVIAPNYARAYSNRGNVLRALKRFDDAIVSYDKALQLKPDYAEAFYNKANALQDLNRLNEALTSYDRALAIKPALVNALIARSTVLQKLHRFDEALACYDHALTIQPDYAEIYYNRAVTLQELRRFDESLASYDCAITIKPDYVSAHWNKSWCLLLIADFANGWQEYEWRRKLKHLQGNYRLFTQPMWSGEQALQGKTILIHDEQGLGDTLQFCRYVQQVKALGATVLFEVNPLLKILLQSLQGVDVLIQRGELLPEFDYYCALLSLPLAFKTDLNSIPCNIPYLFSHKQRVEKWQVILGEKTLPRIGLVWSGSSSNPARSIPLSYLSQLFKHPAQFVSLQKELLDRDVNTLATIPNLQHYGSQLQDFADTAALCELMDLVISIDTSVTHLAGAMGKPLWVLLLYNPDWRWLLDRDDNPWYPSARLFRQPIMDDWQTVLDRVNNELFSQFFNVSDIELGGVQPTTDNTNKFSLAMSLHQQERFTEAAELYEDILKTEPQHIDALHFLGVLKGQLGEAQAAVDLIKQSLALHPDNAAAYSNLAMMYQTLNRFDEALICYDKLLILTPKDLTTLLARSNLLLLLVRLDEALTGFEQILTFKPDSIEAFLGRGSALQLLERFDDALFNYNRALVINPNHAELLFGYANVLYKLKRKEDALNAYNRSLAQNPNSEETLYNRGVVLADLNRIDEAIDSYQQVLAINPNYAEVNNNLGALFKQQERFEEAKICYQHAVKSRPCYTDAHCNLINLLKDQGQFAEAKVCLANALAAVPYSLELRIIQLIMVLPMMPKTADESACVPEQFDNALTVLSTWLAELDDKHGCVTQEGLLPLPFLLAYRVGNHKQQLSRYGDLVANTEVRYAVPIAKQKIRMVVISHHFRRHSVWDIVTRGLLVNLDRSRFELVLYHLGNIEDAETEFAKSLADQWRDTHSIDNVANWLAALQNDAPDVIFYPEIGMDPMSARLASYRLAPLQVASWGHPITTGLPTMDLYFSGELLESSEADSHYRERLIRLPNTGCCTTLMNIDAEPLMPELLAELEQRGGVRFIIAQTIYKFDPIGDGLYADIAIVVPDSRFILLRDRDSTWVMDQIITRLQQTFTERGLNPEQHLIIIPWQSMGRFQSLLDECDVYLDCPSFSGYTTAWQAVHRGIPIITLEGEFMRQRLAAGLLRKIGITDTIVSSRQQYVQCAAQLAQECCDLIRYKTRREAIKNAAPKADNDASVVRVFEQTILNTLAEYQLKH